VRASCISVASGHLNHSLESLEVVVSFAAMRGQAEELGGTNDCT
jgi:hypothetical protein